tara:strand:- start:4475 stop:5860 length:1386 start_codon:yes stop_codon:yes gene_type:complete
MQKYLFLFIPVFCMAKNLTLESRINPPARELMDVEIVGNILIIPGNLDGYDFYDISAPDSPQHISNFEVPMNNRALPGFWVCAMDSFVYFTSRSKGPGSAILDISDPSNPVYLGALLWEGNADPSFEGLDARDSVLAIAAHDDGVGLFHLNDPANPDFAIQIPTMNAWDIVIDSTTLIVGDGEYGIKFYDISNLTDPVLISEYLTVGAVKDLELNGSLLYIAEGSAGVELVDISDRENPILLDRFDTSGLANKIARMNDSYLAVSDWEDIKILEWNETELELVGYKMTGKRTMAIAAKDSVIYSAEWQHLQTFTFGEIENADIDISSWDVAFPVLEVGGSDTFELLIENNGQFPLGISAPYLNHNDFQALNFPDYIDAGGSAITQIIYTRSNQNASGVIQISSNDPDEGEIELQLVGNYEGGIVGVEAPDFTLPVVANGSGSFTLSDYAGKIVVIAFFAPG